MLLTAAAKQLAAVLVEADVIAINIAVCYGGYCGQIKPCSIFA